MVLDSFAQVPLPPATRTARTTARSALGRHLLPPLRNATAAIAARTRAQCTSSATLARLSLCACGPVLPVPPLAHAASPPAAALHANTEKPSRRGASLPTISLGRHSK